MTQFATKDVLDEIERQAVATGVDPALARAIFIAENSDDGILQRKVIDGRTTSSAGARGVMQTMPKTEELLKQAGFLPRDWQYNPADLRGQVQAGLAAIREKTSRQKDKSDPYELAAMYNGGTRTWQNYRAGLMDQIPAETKQYFNKIRTALGGGNGRTDMTPQQMEQQVVAKTPGAQQPAASSQSSTTTSRRSTINAYDPLLLSQALTQGYQIIQSGGSVDAATSKIGAAIGARTAAEQAQQTAIVSEAEKTGALATAKAAAEASAAARRASILTAASVNPDDANNMATQAMESVIRGTAELEVEGAEIDSRMAVGIFDNPLQWLVNQVRLPGMVGSYNAKVEKQNRAIEAAQNLQGLAATQINLSQAVDADLITKIGVAEAAETASRAQTKLTEIQQAVAGNAIRDAQLALAADKEKLAITMDLAELTKQARSENTQLSDREALKVAEQAQLDRVNRFLKMVGSQNQYDSATFKTLPAKTREELLMAAGTGRIGNTLYESIMNVQQLGNSRNMAAEGDAAAVTWLQSVIRTASANMEADLKIAKEQAKFTGKPVKEDEFFAQSVQKLQNLYQAETQDMRTASDSNPFRISYDALLKDPVAAKNPVAKFIQEYGPTSAKPVFTKVDEKLILDKFVADVALGKVNSGLAAAAISDFYRTGMKQQEVLTKYPLFGLDVPLNGYTVVIPSAGLFDRPMAGGTVDLTNPAAVEQYLIKNVASQAGVRALEQQRSIIAPKFDAFTRGAQQ